ncbi:MAG: S8 family serine peptidase [Xanthomonadales bacterium]|nr:S8 family serine peptidase [Xanthomonadales bacterium]
MRLGKIFLCLLLLLSALSISAKGVVHGSLPGENGKVRSQLRIGPEDYVSVFVDLPTNVSRLRIASTLAAGNVDLMLRQGTPHQGSSDEELVAESDLVVATSSGNEVMIIDATTTPKVGPGRWWIAVVNRRGLFVDVTLDVEFETSGEGYAVGPAISGTWYEPARTYQGFFVEIIGPADALVVWFTYEPTGAQAYLIGNGRIEGDQIIVTDLIRTRGGVYGGQFDPAAIVREDWGDLVLTYTGCNSGFAGYTPSLRASALGWVPDQLELERLTGVEGISCSEGANSTPDKALRGGISGAWFRPDRSGEGWFIQVINESQAYVYFFTYTPDGEQAWIGNIGTIIGNTVLVENALRPTGGRFGPDYNPATVTLNPWGAFALVFTDCGAASGRAIGPPGYGESSYSGVTRLTALATTDACGFSSDPFAASGTAVAPAQNFVDGDVNNPRAANQDNDIPSQSQTIGNPALVSGFATAAPTGRQGDRFATEADPIDAYRLQLLAGQTVQLVISDWNPSAPSARDLDLFLFDSGDPSAPLQSAMGSDRSEFINVAASGTYDIVVQAVAGASNYVLSVANGAPISSSAALSLEGEYIDDQLVLRFDDQPGGKAAAQSATSWAAEFGLQSKAGVSGGPMLFELGSGKQRDRAMKALGVEALTTELGGGYALNVDQLRRYQLLRGLKNLRADQRLRYAELNRIARAQGVPNDPGYPLQWHYPQINLPSAWDLTTGSSEIVAAVIDTGISEHPDLAGKIRRDLGVDLINALFSACDGNGADFDATDPGDGRGCGEPNNSSFHGTHVGGTIAAATNNAEGVAGVAWGSLLMPVRTLGRGGSGTTFDIADGIRWAGGGGARGAAPARGADVINLSLGGAGACPSVYQEAINDARGRGAVIVVAAGNSNSSGEFTPANCTGVVNVAALDRSNQPTAYSNCHPSVAVSAPGGETVSEFAGSDLFPPLNNSACKPFSGGTASAEDGVLSTLGPGAVEPSSFAYYQGTSMAAPHVSGVVALMKSIYPGLTPDEFDQLLASGRITTDVLGNGATTRDPFTGFGLINAFAAVREAQLLAGGGAVPPVVVAQPASLVFGQTTTQLNFNLSRQGDGPNVITEIATSVPWLSVSGGGEDGFGDYVASVNRSDLAPANYEGLIFVVSEAAPTQTIAVSMRVGAQEATGNAGFLYVLLLDPVTGVVLAQAEAAEQEGVYPFVFNNLRAGRYLVVAGTDNDNDLSLCDPGEACGRFPDFESFAPVDLGPGSVLPTFAVPADPSGVGQSSAAAPAQGRQFNLR